ncbi:hypothetical protein QBC39DRAFT_58968 [Podospora conica]|nr:hypothetical protein QBC39DRAFT_58968 [Schizothecium conicum]
MGNWAAWKRSKGTDSKSKSTSPQQQHTISWSPSAGDNETNPHHTSALPSRPGRGPKPQASPSSLPGIGCWKSSRGWTDRPETGSSRRTRKGKLDLSAALGYHRDTAPKTNSRRPSALERRHRAASNQPTRSINPVRYTPSGQEDTRSFHATTMELREGILLIRWRKRWIDGGRYIGPASVVSACPGPDMPDGSSKVEREMEEVGDAILRGVPVRTKVC